MAKTSHYRKRTNNKQTRKHKGGVGSSSNKSSSGKTIVNVPESATKNIIVGINGNTYIISKKDLEQMLKTNERGNGPTYM
jgi:hypothetical protein